MTLVTLVTLCSTPIVSGPTLASEVARLRSELAQAQEANKAGGAQLQTVLFFVSGPTNFERVVHRVSGFLVLRLDGSVLSCFRGLARLESSCLSVRVRLE